MNHGFTGCIHRFGAVGRMETIRQQMMALLREKEMNARELSRTLAIREKEIYEHLPHIARTVMAQNKRLVIEPFRCLACGYVFEERKHFTRPGRCPRCKKTHIERPTYQIVATV